MGIKGQDSSDLSTPGYWDNKYCRHFDENATDDQGVERPSHEWLGSYKELEPFFRTHLMRVFRVDDDPLILHLGSGDSLVPRELLEQGYKSQVCVDFSPVVVAKMSARDAGTGIRWKQMDLRHMDDMPDKSVDVAFDKSTLDAMIHGSPWNPPDEVKNSTSTYLREVSMIAYN
jgi:EEF1A lysine methyltransferase 4